MANFLNLNVILETDGKPILNRIVEFLSESLVSLSEGGLCAEMHEKTENFDVFLTIERKNKNDGRNN